MWMNKIPEEVEVRSEDEEETEYDRRSSYPTAQNPFEHEVEVVSLMEDTETRCGIATWSPQWIQKFATKHAFMVIFTLLGVIQGMGWAYFTAIITTLEKRFKISTQTAGIVMTGNELSQVLFSIVISYYGGRGHRPRWISVGVLLSAFACFVLASPHIFFGGGNEAYILSREYADTLNNLVSTTSNYTKGNRNFTSIFMNDEMKSQVQLCDRDIELMDSTECSVGESGSIIPLILIFMSQFMSGIGTLLFFSLGGPYLDDNIKPHQLPMLLGITMSLRLVGPTLGFLFAYGCLKVYISPSLTPLIAPSDPQWLGAWWLGWIILGILMAASSFFIALFPKHLPKAVLKKNSITTDAGTNILSRAGSLLILNTSELHHTNPLPTFFDIPKAVTVLLKNKVNLFNTLAGVFLIFAGIGYWTYIPKYIETMFKQSASNASLVTGTLSIAFQAVGMLISGIAITKFKPSAKKLAAWNAILALAHVITMIILTQFGCDPGDIELGPYDQVKHSYNLSMDCNFDCGCKIGSMLPVCDKNTESVYYSACHAGCSSFDNDNKTMMSDCSCLPFTNSTLTPGTCSSGDNGDSGCYGYFVAFLTLTAIIQLLQSTGRVGTMLISYRCVHPQDKSLAIGLSIFLISVCALVPSPILYGTIIDSVCLVWGSTCSNGKGNCWLYDSKSLRYAFNLTAAGFLLIGGVFDVLVWKNVKDLNLYDESKNTISSAQTPGFRDSSRPKTRQSSSAYS